MTGPIQHGPSLTRYKKTIFFNIFNRFYVSCSFNYFCVISRTQFGFVSAGLRLPKLKCRRKRKKEKNGGRKHGSTGSADATGSGGGATVASGTGTPSGTMGGNGGTATASGTNTSSRSC